MARRKLAVVKKPDNPLRLDIGCGKNKREGFVGVDQYQMDGVDNICDFRKTPWRFYPVGAEGAASYVVEDGSVEEVHCSHFLEHLTGVERVHFMNELYRVLRQGGKACVITPHWASNRAYGDPTHQWPPVSEMFFYYLSKDWRKTQAPHTDAQFNKDGYNCDFEATWGYSMNQALTTRNQEYQQHALQFFKEAAQDTIATLTKK